MGEIDSLKEGCSIVREGKNSSLTFIHLPVRLAHLMPTVQTKSIVSRTVTYPDRPPSTLEAWGRDTEVGVHLPVRLAHLRVLSFGMSIHDLDESLWWLLAAQITSHLDHISYCQTASGTNPTK